MVKKDLSPISNNNPDIKMLRVKSRKTINKKLIVNGSLVFNPGEVEFLTKAEARSRFPDFKTSQEIKQEKVQSFIDNNRKQFARKRNWTMFKNRYPFVEVKDIIVSREGALVINNEFRFVDCKSIVFITKEEADKIKEEFLSIKPKNLKSSTAYSKMHLKDGVPKRGFKSKNSACKVLFTQIKTKKDKRLQVYECIHCGEYHIGHRPSPEKKQAGKIKELCRILRY